MHGPKNKIQLDIIVHEELHNFAARQTLELRRNSG